MADLLISRVAPGIAAARSADPFDSFVIYRIDRARWQQTPQKPGIYLLYGTGPDGKLTVYIGMSTTNMRNRIRSHHVNANKNWFGVLFAVAVPSALLCPAIRGRADRTGERGERRGRHRQRRRGAPPSRRRRRARLASGGEDLRRPGARASSDLFSPADNGAATNLDAPIARMIPLAREYRGRAAQPRPRTAEDPEQATHAYVGAGQGAWGRFEADEPDTRFRVLAGSGWRRPTLTHRPRPTMPRSASVVRRTT